jgi:hypothetical protein
MQEFKCSEQLAAQHYRLHSVEQWPDGPRKQTSISAIQSSIDGLSRYPGTSERPFACILCQSRKTNLKVLEPPDTSRVHASLNSVGTWKRVG